MNTSLRSPTFWASSSTKMGGILGVYTFVSPLRVNRKKASLLVLLFLLSVFPVLWPLLAEVSVDRLTREDREEFKQLLTRVVAQSLYEKKKRASPKSLLFKGNSRLPEDVMRVYATSFGNPGNKGENRYFKDGSRVRRGVVGVALPDTSVTGKHVYVRRVDRDGTKGRWVRMRVKDLGPWFRHDPYWKKKTKTPKAVRYFKKGMKRFDGRVVVNPAGMDITPWGWQKLGVRAKNSYMHSQYVEWRFAKK